MDTKFTGLTTQEVKDRLKTFGTNIIPEKNNSFLIKIIKNLTSPISIMLIVASFLSYLTNKIFDGDFILILLIINIFIILWQENKADNAVKKLNQQLLQVCLVFRDNEWSQVKSSEIVPDDIIKLQYGEIIPVDAKIIEVSNVTVNESSLTGESLPIEKNVGDDIFSGSFLITGIVVAKVKATGQNTSFGKTIIAVERLKKQSLLEKDIIKISEFLALLSIISVLILTVVFMLKKDPLLELLTVDLSIIIAGIPISLPTVMTLIAELGVLNMAKKSVIVRRISSLEDLSNVNYLLTDKTGTLTKNKIEVNDIFSFEGFTQDDVLKYSSFVASLAGQDPIDQSILEKADKNNINYKNFTVLEFVPADSTRKHSTLKLRSDGKDITISLGAPQIIEKICDLQNDTYNIFFKKINEYASEGNRTIALAITTAQQKEEHMTMIGLLSLSDAVRPEAASVIEFLKENGINTTMVTGDHKAIALQILNKILPENKKIITKTELDLIDDKKMNKDFFLNTGAFAEILPQDKLRIVQRSDDYFTVAANGDGVNDLPAIKAANVGIAVSNAVGALKASADIILLTEGIGVIRDAIVESRNIFERINTYSLYRISESFRLIITLCVLGVIYQVYPLTPLQIILIALLNDLPIISLAFDRVKTSSKPKKLDLKKQIFTSSLFGTVGIINSLLLLVIATYILNLNWEIIQTLFFLKLTVSGHMLIFVAHTKEKWFKFLPSKEVMLSTATTQIIASILAFTGFLMPSKISLILIIFIWIWSFFWMQISELTKIIQKRIYVQDI